jgi:hypothetical protein
MKTILKRYMLTILLIACSVMAISQPGSPPPPPSGHGNNGNQGGGFAPVGEGIFLLAAMSAAYGFRKMRKAFRSDAFSNPDDDVTG